MLRGSQAKRFTIEENVRPQSRASSKFVSHVGGLSTFKSASRRPVQAATRAGQPVTNPTFFHRSFTKSAWGTFPALPLQPTAPSSSTAVTAGWTFKVPPLPRDSVLPRIRGATRPYGGGRDESESYSSRNDGVFSSPLAIRLL
jgi:hypothetical protein